MENVETFQINSFVFAMLTCSDKTELIKMRISK